MTILEPSEEKQNNSNKYEIGVTPRSPPMILLYFIIVYILYKQLFAQMNRSEKTTTYSEILVKIQTHQITYVYIL